MVNFLKTAVVLMVAVIITEVVAMFFPKCDQCVTEY